MSERDNVVAARNFFLVLLTLNILAAIFVFVGAPRDGALAAGFVVVAGTLGSTIYFMPALVALSRGHTNSGAIIVLDLLLGWLVIPWVVALVWACSNSRATVVEVRHDEPSKRCQFCDETVRAAAAKCKHCGSMLGGDDLVNPRDFLKQSPAP